jgi:hypothetical protein
MPKLIVVIGLPGSGKTHYLRTLKAEKIIAGFYDDYQRGSYGKDMDPHLSKHYGPLLSKLKQGHTMAVADIAYCHQQHLDAFLRSVLKVLPDTKVELHYFENNPTKALANIKKRARPNFVDKEIAYVKDNSPLYIIPKVKKLTIYVAK